MSKKSRAIAKRTIHDLRMFDALISDVRTRKWMGGGNDSFTTQLDWWAWCDEVDENNSH